MGEVGSQHLGTSINPKGIKVKRQMTSNLQENKMRSVLVRVSIPGQRDHDQGDSYNRQHLLGPGLQIQRFSLLS